jgi:hypothetical protein
MLRVPQHERKKINDINSFPFVTSINSVQALSAVEGLLRVFQQPARDPGEKMLEHRNSGGDGNLEMSGGNYTTIFFFDHAPFPSTITGIVK